MSISKKACRSLLLNLLMTIPLLAPDKAGSAELCLPPPTTDAQCLECHKAMVDQELTKPYVHQPFREMQCMVCHLDGELFAPEKTAYKSDLKVTWLTWSSLPSVEHWFTLPTTEVTGDIYLDIMVPSHGVYRNIIDKPDFVGLPEMARDMTPPELSGIKVSNIEKGIMLSATISWESDEMADTRVNYGIGNLKSTAHIAEMTRSHQVTINGLKEASEYQYQVASVDYLGNLATSKTLTFSTNSTVAPTIQDLPKPAKKELTWDREIFQDRQSGLIILKISTSVPTDAAVGIAKESKALTSSARKPCRHRLKSALETSMNVCQPCHEDYIKGATRHPLLVKPKAEMKIPPEFFLLADGRIACITCHSAHSSDYPNQLVKSGRVALCRSCHTDK